MPTWTMRWPACCTASSAPRANPALPGSRAFVHASVYDEFKRRLLAGVQALRVGDPASERTQMGPLVNMGHRATVERYVQLGRDEGGSAGRRRAPQRRAVRQGQLLPAHRHRGPAQQRAHVPGGDLRPGAGAAALERRGRPAGPVQRQRVRPGLGHLDARLQDRLAHRPRAADRHGVDQHLQAVLGQHAVWRRQDERHRAREGPPGHPGVHRPEEFLLGLERCH
jgi:hypothetical protein